jgi:hypothetical protein
MPNVKGSRRGRVAPPESSTGVGTTRPSLSLRGCHLSGNKKGTHLILLVAKVRSAGDFMEAVLRRLFTSDARESSGVGVVEGLGAVHFLGIGPEPDQIVVGAALPSILCRVLRMCLQLGPYHD